MFYESLKAHGKKSIKNLFLRKPVIEIILPNKLQASLQIKVDYNASF